MTTRQNVKVKVKWLRCFHCNRLKPTPWAFFNVREAYCWACRWDDHIKAERAAKPCLGARLYRWLFG
jgi:hypothetical protein